MCLPDFKEFIHVEEDNPLVGYRAWRLPVEGSNSLLKSQSVDYMWEKAIEGPHEVKDTNSGIYAYNYNNFYYYYYYYDNNNFYNYYNYYYYNPYYNYYDIGGIIYQYGRVAIHRDGQRSEYAKIQTLFTIQESDAKGPKKFIKWIEEFNSRVRALAEFYNANTVNWQDFKE